MVQGKFDARLAEFSYSCEKWVDSRGREELLSVFTGSGAGQAELDF